MAHYVLAGLAISGRVAALTTIRPRRRRPQIDVVDTRVAASCGRRKVNGAVESPMAFGRVTGSRSYDAVVLLTC